MISKNFFRHYRAAKIVNFELRKSSLTASLDLEVLLASISCLRTFLLPEIFKNCNYFCNLSSAMLQEVHQRHSKNYFHGSEIQFDVKVFQFLSHFHFLKPALVTASILWTYSSDSRHRKCCLRYTYVLKLIILAWKCGCMSKWKKFEHLSLTLAIIRIKVSFLGSKEGFRHSIFPMHTSIPHILWHLLTLLKWVS